MTVEPIKKIIIPDTVENELRLRSLALQYSSPIIAAMVTSKIATGESTGGVVNSIYTYLKTGEFPK